MEDRVDPAGHGEAGGHVGHHEVEAGVLRQVRHVLGRPVRKLSTQVTRCPSANSRSHRCDPRKPAPPVTTVRGCVMRHYGHVRVSRRAVRSGSSLESGT